MQNLTLHIIWLVVAISVYLFGIWEGRGQGYKKRKAEEEQEKKENPPVAPASPAKPVTVKVDDPGLMRIKNENGFLTLDLDGTRVDTSALSADQRKRLIEMLNVIRPWLEGRPAPVTATPPPPPPQAQPRPATPTPTYSAPRPVPATQPLPSRPQATSSKEERANAPATSIVGQIDAILQEQLVGSPLEARGIYLSQSPEGGVIVNVGIQKFTGIDEVTDPEIKAALRSAITVWENKYTPGL